MELAAPRCPISFARRRILPLIAHPGGMDWIICTELA
jgi:hypothetical protein